MHARRSSKNATSFQCCTIPVPKHSRQGGASFSTDPFMTVLGVAIMRFPNRDDVDAVNIFSPLPQYISDILRREPHNVNNRMREVSTASARGAAVFPIKGVMLIRAQDAERQFFGNTIFVLLPRLVQPHRFVYCIGRLRQGWPSLEVRR